MNNIEEITANEAREMVYQNVDLDNIMVKIHEAIKNSKFYVEVPMLNLKECRKLKSLGYSVENKVSCVKPYPRISQIFW